MAPAVTALTGPRRITRRIILQKARGHPRRGFHGMEAHDFRVSFTPLTGVLFTVPSRYCALSVAACSLPWTVVSPASVQVLRAWTYSGARRHRVSGGYRTLTCSGAVFQAASPTRGAMPGARQRAVSCPPTPAPQRLAPWHGAGLGLDPVRSPLLRVWFSLPPATEMFQLAGCPRSYDRPPCGGGCPIRRSADHSLPATPRGLSERCPVLRRHAAPGHPSCAHSVFPTH